MFWHNLAICAYLWATVLTTRCILGQQQAQFYRKPWPTYSLQNMPQTQFTCHDKILGGYYADAETQCQMFHVCVKVAGVGVQDFRFLCPNSTAFDQEAQICADWSDVDCEQSVLYYGSDNFDLYRIGSGFESKRAPLAEEDEATFHLQRAETADVRRSKETRVDQKSRPDQPPNYTKQFEAATTRNLHANHKYTNLNENTNQRKSNNDVVKRPVVNYYTPTTSTSTTTTTERSNSIDESKQEYDDIFKGSHSSHFFSNRNGGREDDILDYNVKSKGNDFVNFKKKTETSTVKSHTQSTRSRRIQTSTSAATPTTSTTHPPTSKKIILHSTFNNDVFASTPQYYRASSSSALHAASSTSTTTTTRAPSNANRFNVNVDPYQTQQRIEPTTYNPANSIYHQLKTTPAPKYNDLQRGTVQKNQLEKSKAHSKPTSTARKIQKLERTEAQQSKLGPRNSSFVNQNEFSEFTKIKVEQPKPFQPVQTFRAPPAPTASKLQGQEPQYFRSRGPKAQVSRVGNQDPAPFSAPLKKQQHNEPKTLKTKVTVSNSTPELSPRGFSNRGSINYKASTQRNELDLYTPTTTQVTKKFSTLVPRELYSPTTYKPAITKASKDKDYNLYLTQQTSRPSNRQHKPQTSFTTTSEPTTANPYYNADEDDGQYHPELYEVDFPRNRLNSQRSSTTKSTVTHTKVTTTKKPTHVSNHRFDSPQIHLKTQQRSYFQKEKEQDNAQPVDLSDEEELFKTAHSLNFGAASINKLRADIIKAEKTSQQYNSQYSPHLVQSSSPQVTAQEPSTTSRSTIQYTYPSMHSTSTTTQHITTSKRPFTYLPTITTPKTFFETKPTKLSKSGKSKGKKASSKTASSKRPPHADEDTSYDYAYYDSDTLSESPQEYAEYEIAEFTKTYKN